MASKALFAGVEFDLFTSIARGVDLLPALVNATGIAENRLVALLTALKSLGLITERDGRFINAPATARYLVAGAPGDFRTTLSLSMASSATIVSDIWARHYVASGYSLIRAFMRASFMALESAGSI